MFDLTVNFHHEHCIPTICPRVSEDGLIQIRKGFLGGLINGGRGGGGLIREVLKEVFQNKLHRVLIKISLFLNFKTS